MSTTTHYGFQEFPTTWLDEHPGAGVVAVANSLLENVDAALFAVIGGGGGGSAVSLAPTADQTIAGPHALILNAGNGLRFPTSAVATALGGSFFAFSATTTPFNAVTDNLLNLGYNCLPGNSPIDPTKPMFAWQLEIDYFDGVDHWNEWHYDFLPVGGTFVRPFIISWKNNDPNYWGAVFDIGTSGSSFFSVTANRSAIPLFSINSAAFRFQHGLPLIGSDASAVQQWALNGANGNAAFNGSIQGGTAGVSSALSFAGLSTQGPNLFALSTEAGLQFSITPSGALAAAGLATFQAGINISSGQPLSWNGDVGFSRNAAGVLYVGNGSAGDTSGRLLGNILQALTAVQVGNGSVSAPSLSFFNDTGTGLYNNGAGVLFCTTAGVASWITASTVFRIKSSSVYGISSGDPALTAADVGLSRLGAASFAIGNGTQGDISGKLKLAFIGGLVLSIRANNAAAISAGLVAGDLYRSGADPDAVCIVH